jgi:choline-sulfatase/uncharacterized sulfatase
MPPLNVLFILSDQHNAKVLGHKGHPDVRTPNIDRLAAEGMRFDNAITQNPICTPSRVCFLSGQYAHNHGYYGLCGPRPSLPTVLGHFRRHGWRTAAIGKIHCPEYWVEDDCDFFREVCNCSVGGCPEYSAYLKSRNLLHLRDDGGFPELGARGNQGFDARPSDLPYEHNAEGWSVRQAIEFMDSCRVEGRPFFAHVSFFHPHQMYAPARQFWDMYDESRLHLPPNADYDLAAAGKAPHMVAMAKGHRTGEWAYFEPRTFEAARLRKLHGYLGCVSMVDHAVGELMEHLRQSGLQQDTVVVYSSDHGDYAVEHGLMEKAPGICSDAITRIPHIWRVPGITPAGGVDSRIVETVDVAPTLCSLAGLPGMETADGVDIAPLLAGTQTAAPHQVGVTEFAWSKSVRKGDWRLVFYPDGMFAADGHPHFGELYNLQADPWEMRNLYFDPQYAAVVAELRGDLLNWLVKTTRPVTTNCSIDHRSDQTIERWKVSVNADGKIHPWRLAAIKGTRRNYL